MGLAVVVDLRLCSRVELDIADLTKCERLVLLLPLHALLGLAGWAAGLLCQLHCTLGAVGWAQGSLHACRRKDRPTVRTGGQEQVSGEAGEPNTGPTPVVCVNLGGSLSKCNSVWARRHEQQHSQEVSAGVHKNPLLPSFQL